MSRAASFVRIVRYVLCGIDNVLIHTVSKFIHDHRDLLAMLGRENIIKQCRFPSS
jgi:hypothetical protein